MKAVVAKIALCVVACWALVYTLAAPACARQGARAPRAEATPPPTPAPSPDAAPAPARTPLSDLKTQVEIEKLKAEIAGLQAANSALDVNFKWLTTWITAVGGISITLLVALAGIFFNRTQTRKLAQDRRLGREEHLLKVFRDLGDERARVRVGAVAVLVQRLTDLTEKRRALECDWPQIWWRRWKLDREEQKEAPTIVSVLISVSKHEKNVDIQKYIADGIATGLFAILDPKQVDKREATLPEPKDRESPLREYDFQRAQFQNAWWYSIDARGVDFYKVNLSRAGLRRALLSKAILKNADLTEAVLVGADLRDADLSGATLDGADLRGATLDGADVAETKFGRAKLAGVDFSKVRNFSEADFSEAIW